VYKRKQLEAEERKENIERNKQRELEEKLE